MRSIRITLPPSLPPRTRGSTWPRPARRRLSGASPAHAGIDPRRGCRRRSRPRFPRARGDRPLGGLDAGDLVWLPPRTRGSTCLRFRLARFKMASPAHAGIDPRSRPSLPTWISFPRARGDRPPAAGYLAADAALPPRTRGSTLRTRDKSIGGNASPAHAGIDP